MTKRLDNASVLDSLGEKWGVNGILSAQSYYFNILMCVTSVKRISLVKMSENMKISPVFISTYFSLTTNQLEDIFW